MEIFSSFHLRSVKYACLDDGWHWTWRCTKRGHFILGTSLSSIAYGRLIDWLLCLCWFSSSWQFSKIPSHRRYATIIRNRKWVLFFYKHFISDSAFASVLRRRKRNWKLICQSAVPHWRSRSIDWLVHEHTFQLTGSKRKRSFFATGFKNVGVLYFYERFFRCCLVYFLWRKKEKRKYRRIKPFY